MCYGVPLSLLHVLRMHINNNKKDAGLANILLDIFLDRDMSFLFLPANDYIMILK